MEIKAHMPFVYRGSSGRRRRLAAWLQGWCAGACRVSGVAYALEGGPRVGDPLLTTRPAHCGPGAGGVWLCTRVSAAGAGWGQHGAH